MKSENKKNGIWMKRARIAAVCLSLFSLQASVCNAQQMLSLDSCRAMALRNNKQLGVSRIKQDMAKNIRKSARTKYLPHVSALGTYLHTTEPISLLNDDQKAMFGGLGNTAATLLQSNMPAISTLMTQFGGILAQAGSPAINAAYGQFAQGLQTQIGQSTPQLANTLNAAGQQIVDAFDTDTRNAWAGSVVVTQPVFMGGAIVAMNKLAAQNEEMQANSAEARQQLVIYAIDQAYWQVVSLKHKQRLAQSYADLVKKLDSDVQKMINEGVATRSDGLSVSVKASEAEMALQQVENGLDLSKMLLCQLIGLPSDTQIMLQDEDSKDLEVTATIPTHEEKEIALANRPELKMLDNGVEIARQSTNILKAGNLPQVALIGGYSISNPSVFNGFEKKFKGFWNVGVLVRVPIWNWGDVTYKVRTAKGATAIASLEREEAREKIELQVNQSTYKMEEANKRLIMAQQNIQKADENLRTANLGFREGVISPTVVMEAQTAWLQAQSKKIDAQIDAKLSQADLRKAQGTLGIGN